MDATAPVGSVIAFAGNVPPDGWLICDGSELSRTDYAALFAVIGTLHGSGDGTTTFNIPDYRGRFLRGVDDGAGHDPDADLRTAMSPGGNTGDGVGSIQGDEIASHTHELTRSNGTTGDGLFIDAHSMGATPLGSGGPTAATGGAETRPKNAAVWFVIKY